MTKTTELVGPFAEARQWLVDYMGRVNFMNDMIKGTLTVDWTPYDKVMASYLLGCLWGRLRQMDSTLETESEYGALVMKELVDTVDDGQGET